MELDQLRAYVAVAEYGTVSKAAEVLHVSQPALSRTLQRLETELGVALFDRTRNSLALNDVGCLLLEHARDVLRDVNRLEDAIYNLARKQRTLRVGTCAPAPLWRLAMVVSERMPNAIIVPETFERRELERCLAAGQVDLAILTSPLPLPNATSVAFMHENLSVSLPAEHPLAVRESVTLADLDGEEFLLYAGIGFWHELCRDYLPNSHFVVQEDRFVFDQQALSSPLLSFVSDAFGSQPSTLGRMVVPISDVSAHVTFYLSYLNTNRDRLEDILALFEI